AFSFGADGSFQYTPANNQGPEGGSDSFTYRVSDGVDTTGPIEVTIEVLNNKPIGFRDYYVTARNTPLTVGAGQGLLQNDWDADGDALTAIPPTGTDNPEHGTVTVNPNGSFTHTPNSSFRATDPFRHQPRDSMGHA